MPKTVAYLNAELLAAWFLPDSPLRKDALAIRQDLLGGRIDSFAMPDFMLIRFAAILGKAGLSPAEVVTALGMVHELGVEMVPLDPEILARAIGASSDGIDQMGMAGFLASWTFENVVYRSLRKDKGTVTISPVKGERNGRQKSRPVG